MGSLKSTKNLQYLRNGARYDQGYYDRLIMKSHTRFRSVPKSTTLDDLERCIQGLPKAFKYPTIISGTAKDTNFKFCMRFHTIDHNKIPLTISGKVAVGVARDSRFFSGHPYIGRSARSSELSSELYRFKVGAFLRHSVHVEAYTL